MRYFVAAFPDDDVRQAVQQQLSAVHARAPRARPLHARNLHVTIAFIGPMTPDQVAAVAGACRAHRFAPIRWRLDRIGRFARAGVVWAGGEDNASMLRLMHETGEALDSLGIDYDRRPAAPHVTLLRNARSFDTNLRIDPPIDWSVQTIALYASSRDDAGPVYLRIDPSP